MYESLQQTQSRVMNAVTIIDASSTASETRSLANMWRDQILRKCEHSSHGSKIARQT